VKLLTKEERIANNRHVGEAYLHRYAVVYKDKVFPRFPEDIKYHPDAMEQVQNFPPQPYGPETDKKHRIVSNEAMLFLTGVPCGGPGVPDWRALPEKSVVTADENTCTLVIWFQGTLPDGTVLDSWETDFWRFDEYGRITYHFVCGEALSFSRFMAAASGMDPQAAFDMLHALNEREGNFEP